MSRLLSTRFPRRQFLGLGAALVASSALLAWQNSGNNPDAGAADSTGAQFSTDVNVVNVLVSVRDKRGAVLRDLTKDDFTLEEAGRPQVIKYFAQQLDMPLTLGLLVDTSGSQRSVLDQERAASLEFFRHVMREDRDRAFVIHFDHEVELLQDLTSSRRSLESSLSDLEVSRPRLNRRGGGGPGGRYPGGGYPGGPGGGFRGGTALYDAVLLGSDEIMRKQPGRKAVIVLSDGVDNASKVSLASAIESAQRADTLVYAIHFAGVENFGGGFGPNIGFGGPGIGRRGRRGGGNRFPQRNPVDGKKILERIARETGGGYFEVSNKMPLDRIYDRIEEDLRNQYNLGYTPDQPGAGYRKIQVAVQRKDAVIQARDGYYSK